MKLRYSPSSPYTRKVVIVAAELGLLDRITLVPTNVREPTAELYADNALGKIPVLILDDGSTVFDSRVACEYLDAIGGGKLFPANGAARWRALTHQALADGLLDAGYLVRLESRRPKEQQSAAFVELQTKRMVRAIESIAATVSELPREPTIGSVTFAVALDYLDFRYPELGWRKHQALADWYGSFAKRPSLQGNALREKT